MVAKISRGASLYGAVAYNHSKVEIERGKILSSNKMIEGENGELDIRSAMKSFALHLHQDTKVEKPIIHISLNPHPEDILSDEQLTDIGRGYLERMGYGNQPYIIYKHDDIERAHIHIVTTNVDRNGRKIDDKNDFHRSKTITRDIEQRYGLHTAERKKRGERFTFKSVDAAKGNIKIQIGNVVKAVATSYHFQSFNEYRTLLAQYNICVEQSKGERNGRPYAGLIYYATNDNGDKVSNPFKSSLYGRSVGYVAIQSKTERNKERIRSGNLNRQTAQKVRDVLRSSSSRDSFADGLRERNIDVIFRENETGRMYGVTYIDHENRSIFNGSRLGQDLSANAISERFETPQPTQTAEQDGAELLLESQNIESDNSISMGGLFDFITDSPDESENDENALRQQVKPKKRRGL